MAQHRRYSLMWGKYLCHGNIHVFFCWSAIVVVLFFVFIIVKHGLHFFATVVYGLLVAIDGCERGKLCGAGVHRHAWVLCRCGVRKVYYVIVCVCHSCVKKAVCIGGVSPLGLAEKNAGVAFF